MEEKVYTINLNKIKDLTSRYVVVLEEAKVNNTATEEAFAQMSSEELREFAKDLRRG